MRPLGVGAGDSAAPSNVIAASCHDGQLSCPLVGGTWEQLKDREILGATGGTGKGTEAGECGWELRFIEHFRRKA